MKKKFFLLAVLTAFISLTSCEPDDEFGRVVIPQSQTPGQSFKVSFCVQTGNEMTKASSVSKTSEDAYSSFRVLVFDAKGVLETSANSENTGGTIKATAVVTAGPKTIVAITNAPASLSLTAGTTTLTSFNSAKLALADSPYGAFIMTGKTTETIFTNTSVSIDVKRLVARVKCSKVQTSFTGDNAWIASDMDAITVKSIYLANAPKYAYFGGTAATEFYNSAASDAYACKDNGAVVNTLLSESSLSGNIKGTDYTAEHYFYTMPAAANVIKLILGVEFKRGTNSKTYYYSCDMPEIKSNNTYEVSYVKLTKLGAENPGATVDGNISATCTFGIIIHDWETGSTFHYDI